MFVFIVSCETKEYAKEESATRLENTADDPENIPEFSGLETATSVTDYSVTLNWTHSDELARYYIWDVTGGKEERIATLSAPKSSFTLDTLTSGTSYSFKVTAQAEDGRGVDNLNILSITTLTRPNPPYTVILTSPSTDTDVDRTPSFLIYPSRAGDTVELYSDACSTKVGEAVATSSITTVSVSNANQLAEGSYNFYVKLVNKNGVSSSCSSIYGATASYTYQFCPVGYIEVPVNTGIGNKKFCVMAYEAKAWQDFDNDGDVDFSEVDSDGCNESSCTTKNWGLTSKSPRSTATGSPWRMISQRNAKAECQSLGENYDLISNAEWMAVAREIEENANNWSSGELGVGCVARGNVGTDDKCSYQNFGIDGGTGRSELHSHELSNGEIIYDLVGNASEWIDLGKEEDLTLAPQDCDQTWMSVEGMSEFCNNYFLSNEFTSSNPGLLTFETYENVYTVMTDVNDKLYFATDGGVATSTTQARSFQNYTPLNGLATNDITGGVFVDSDETMYVGTNKGLHISTNGGESFNLFTTNEGLPSNIVRDIFVKVQEDGGGNEVQAIYVATNAGLAKSLDGGDTFTVFTTADGLADDTTYSVYLDDDDNIYVGTLAGLSISTNGISFTSSTTANGLGSNRVEDVFIDQKGTLYAATTAGLSLSTDGGANFTNKTTADGLGSNRINAIYIDENDLSDFTDDIIYVATDVGLSISQNDGVSFNTRLTRDGLIDNTVYDVAVDSEGYIYAATEAGVSVSLDDGDSFSYSKDSLNNLGGKTSIGLGQIFGGVGEGAYRGGSYQSGSYAGIYMMSFEAYPGQAFEDIGFRCVYRP